jgi:DNA polymerase-3 subunit epsilon
MDSLLLASVYVELLGERQATLGLGGQGDAEMALELRMLPALPRPQPLPSRLMEAGEALHREFVKTLGPKALWLRFL